MKFSYIVIFIHFVLLALFSDTQNIVTRELTPFSCTGGASSWLHHPEGHPQ